MKDEEKKRRDALEKTEADTRDAAAVRAPAYAGTYEKPLRDSYEALASRPVFRYDLREDGLYQQYKDDYIQNGSLAMKDTVGQAAALTGGYGSSYAESVGQQRYDAYLQQLGEIVPELYQLAYSRYQDEGDALRERYELLGGLRDREYEAYTDALDGYRADRALAYQREQDELAREEQAREQSYQRSQSEAAARAKYGDFGGYAALYGEETAKQMREYWIASNPAAAYGMGLISAERYYAMTGGSAPGQTTAGAGGGSRSYYPATAPDGRDAKQVQRELRNMGYNIAVDGAWGPKSQRAWDEAHARPAAAGGTSGHPRAVR